MAEDSRFRTLSINIAHVLSLEGEARIWLDKEPSRSILTWEDLLLKFINQFFPPSKTTYLQNEITNFLQKPNETFNEGWERFKDLLRQCPHHGFSELHQLDTFYNALNPNDQDSLDSATRGNFLDKIPCECFLIIESKSKVRYSRSRITDSRANTNAPLSSSSPSNSFDLQQIAQIAASLEDKLDIHMNCFEKSLNDMKNSFVTPTAPIKAVEEDFQKKFEQKQGDFQNQMMNFMQNLYNNKPSSSSSLPSNTIPNPKGEAKAIMTRSDMSYKEPPIPPPGVQEQGPAEKATDTELPSTEDIQLYQFKFKFKFKKINQLKNLPLLFQKPKLIFLIRQDSQRKRFVKKMTFLPLNSWKSFATFISNKKLKLPMLNDTKMVLELADRTISKPTGVAEKVFVKVGKFYFPTDFVVLDFLADPRVSLILGRPFLSTTHAIINVLTIQCGDIPSIKKVEQINKIDFIDAGGIDFDSKEIENFLNDDSIPLGVEDSPFNMEEDIIFLESLLREDLSPPHLIIPNQTKLLIEEPKHPFKMSFHDHFKSTFHNDKINSDEINSHIESNSDESTSNHDTVKFDYLDEFYGPLIPIHILEEERIRKEHADYNNRMEMLFTINPRPYPSTHANTNVEFFSSLPIPIQESDPYQEEIDVVAITNDVLPLRVENEDSDEEVDVVDVLRIDNFI
nr:reverse transcriptase domain-containing protein [Tanacetum cinerariifolium]